VQQGGGDSEFPVLLRKYRQITNDMSAFHAVNQQAALEIMVESQAGRYLQKG